MCSYSIGYIGTTCEPLYTSCVMYILICQGRVFRKWTQHRAWSPTRIHSSTIPGVAYWILNYLDSLMQWTYLCLPVYVAFHLMRPVYLSHDANQSGTVSPIITMTKIQVLHLTIHEQGRSNTIGCCMCIILVMAPMLWAIFCLFSFQMKRASHLEPRLEHILLKKKKKTAF